MVSATTPSPPELLTARQLLADHRFVRLWLGQFVSIIGDFVAMFAIQAAVVFRMHGTARDVAGITLTFLLPLILIGPVAGVFVDRWNPRRIMILSDVIRGGLILLLAFSTQLGQIYAVCAALSCVSSFFLPAQSVTMPLIVKREGLVAASSLMQQGVQLARILSPALASGLVGYLGEAACYYLDALTFFFSAAMLWTLTYQRPAAPEAKRVGTLLNDLGKGIGFVLKHPTFSFVILSMTAGTFAIGCFAALLSVYLRDVLGAGTYLYGGIGTLMAIGTIGGAAVMGKFLSKPPRDRCKSRGGPGMVSAGLFSVGVFIFIMAACRSRAATLICAVGIGASIALVTVASTALLQGETPPEFRGRVSSSSMALVSMAQAAAMIFAGGCAARFGIVRLFYGSALMLFAVGIAGAWKLSRVVDRVSPIASGALMTDCGN